MLKAEYDEIFQALYKSAVKAYPEIEDMNILYNTNAEHGIEIGKGVGDNYGEFRISCRGDNYDPSVAVASFGIGLALVVHDIKYGPYNDEDTTEEEHERLREIERTIVAGAEVEHDE